jgi:drug/metabolite transporter (DMT)-like permease
MTTEQCFVIPEAEPAVAAAPAEPSALPTSTSALPDRTTLIAFGFFVLLAGGASVAVRITYAELPPFWSAAARFFLAGLVFWLIMLIRKIPVPRGRALLGAALFGILTVGVSFTLVAWGLVATPASLYQVIMALVPLLTIFFAFLHGLEKIRWQGILGALLAVAGIAVVVGGSDTSSVSIPHILAIILAAASMAEGGVIAKKFPRSHPVATNAIAVSIGALILFVVSLITGEQFVIPVLATTWIAFIYVLVFVTIFAFLLYLYVLGRWTASGTSYGFVLIPLVTVVLATNLAGESITFSYVIGAVLVLSGVIFGALLPSKPPKAGLAADSAGAD